MKLDLLLRNADIITMDERRPHATSLGVWQGRIVGLDDDLAGLDAAEVLDLGGATVTPGFIDAHCHTTWFGLGLGELDVSAARGLHQLYALLEAGMAADSGQPEAGPETDPGTGPAPDWLLATGFSQQQHGGEFPDITVLDRITGNRPLFMRHNSGHMAVVNTAALRLAGAEPASFPDPDGGVIVRDADGRPTGLVQETAQQLIQQLILPYSSEAIEAALDRATTYYAAEGITSFTEAGIGGGWIGHSPVELAAYQRAAAAGRLHARAQLMPVLDVLHPLGGQHPPGTTPAGLDLGIASGFGGDFLSLGPAKVFLDGSLLGETAAVSHDYCSHGGTDNTGNTGYFQAEPEALRAKIEAAYAAGWSIAAHAIGDRAVDLAIDIITGCAAKYGPRAVPNRIEHASMTRPEQLPRLAAAGIAVTPQASFFFDGGDGMTLSLGPERLGWAYRAASFLAAGVTLAGSSDRPVADGNVLRGMQAFVDRGTASGAVFGNPDERLSPFQALAAYTTGAAVATGTSGIKGSLTTGKLADFTVLSGSPLTAGSIADLEVLATAVGGSFTFRTPGLTFPVAADSAATGPFFSAATNRS